MTWQEVIAESNAAMQRGDRDRGLTYTPNPKATDLANVREYLSGFGWRGVGTAEVSKACMADPSNVRRILASLVAAGQLRVEESITRGPLASRRKTYFTDGPRSVVLLEPEVWDRIPAS